MESFPVLNHRASSFLFVVWETKSYDDFFFFLIALDWYAAKLIRNYLFLHANCRRKLTSLFLGICTVLFKFPPNLELVVCVSIYIGGDNPESMNFSGS